ncbi:MAG TPA: hypothetical protein VJK53_02495 [Candidatus Paceibacterota bacterium]
MTLVKNLIIAILGIALAFGLYVFVGRSGLIQPLGQKEEETATTTPPAVEAVQYIIYGNDTYGVTFHYPEGYVMKEFDLGDEERKHKAITLVRQEEATPPENGEGPTGISLDFYHTRSQNDLDQTTLHEWLDTASSNFTLGSGTHASTTVAGIEAVQYRWSGLHEGETTAFLHKGNVVAISVTYLSPEDEHVAVYRNLLQSLDAH